MHEDLSEHVAQSAEAHASERRVAIETVYEQLAASLALAWPDGHVEAFEGRVDGTIIWPPRGDKGFGYDPMFQPHGHAISFGEMDPDKKHAMSHRADAFAQLVKAVF